MDAAPPKRGLVAKATTAVSRRPAAAAALIAALAVALVAVLVRYRGLGPLGPYHAADVANPDGAVDAGVAGVDALGAPPGARGSPSAAADAGDIDRMIADLNK